MSDREQPPGPTGPLARLRAQLAAPRGYKKIDALLSQDDAKGAVAALSPNEIFELVHEVGFQDAHPLLELATPAQFQGCLDLDGWAKDEFELAALKPWLGALIELGFEKLGEVWASLDFEFRALILQKQTYIWDVSLEEEPAEDNEHAIMATPDRFFMLQLPDEENDARLFQQLIEDLYRSDILMARHTIMAARSEPPAELEEMSYRWRAGRLADLGYVDFYDALDLFKQLDADTVKIGEGTQDNLLDEDASRMPLAIAEEIVGRNFLARAIGSIEDPTEAARLESAMAILVNKVLAAARAKPGQSEVVRRGALYATATLSLGLETVARGDLAKAKQALQTIALQRLFRVGHTVTLKLARLGQALAPRSLTSGSPTRELVAGLCSPRPLFAKAADDPPMLGMRPFESAADLRRAGELLTGLTVRIALVESLGVDVVAMGQAPEPRPTLDDHIRTALARAVLGGPLRGEALSQAELTDLRDRGMVDGNLTEAARRAGHDAIVARMGAAQLGASGAVLGKLVDGWLANLEAILGGIKGETVDPRFVDGVLVEAKLS
ncbi:MAG TPA: DUF6178 family protein [Kofleriaceae bacterium]|jgi:hypothetical protein